MEQHTLTNRDYENKKLLKRISSIDLSCLIDEIDGLHLEDAKNKIVEILDNNVNPKWNKQIVKYAFGDDYSDGKFEIINYRYETEDEYNNRCDAMDLNIKEQIKRRDDHEQERVDNARKLIMGLPKESRYTLVQSILSEGIPSNSPFTK